ncbi:MAG: DNA-processing protein DprA [Hydrogenophaga sp.]|jgi:DNA processing protein|uniref:DNA-processing protein DprA n=1 Tax=Hydrogenophaga sp. TaxID=1904254 RepID=UPI002716190D|nr:DNA-processing protein DprA [Hydrogenophaga sp.]MDO9483223.1 DNA-processing protein DprA [Hydrogenophaga sp.]MDP1894532.1 DNA-processing protein DprA [Hydrogenophaga sp.]MDP3344896.1 DNA-processing protein DprA [Hydrogenophaga sp.]MDP3372599.1 DNA-processing protein DprA [Hydrogenophaga sp.]MDP3807998.1 DNA-processing protein DprA [Hydrogenophaga sp.]
MASDELASWLRLLLTPGVGNASARKLLATFGLPEAVFRQSPPALRAVVGPQAALALLTPPDNLDAAVARLQTWLAEAPNRHVLTLGDARYPPELLQMADPPLVLYVVGQLDALQHPRRLAIVGSRNPTPQGEANARQFACALGEAGVCVVSGLALGVDGAAHEGALDADAPTIAVVGTGLDRVYPKRHLSLAHRIVARGALVSEYALGTPPLPANFPQRNRIIAGLSQGTLVVEAAVQSGSLITARLAAEQGREVFAIPGSIHAPQARGCHALIRQGAKLVESAQDILEDLRLTEAPAHTGTADVFTDNGTNPPTAPDPLLSAMGFDPVSLDALQARTGLSTAHLQARLLELELQGDVGRLPGGLLQRIGRS